MADGTEAQRLLDSFPAVSQYEWSSKDPSRQFIVDNPATGKAITTIQGGDAQTAAFAVEASHKAFATWKKTTRQERCGYLMRAAAELEKHVEEFVLLLCLENGKPRRDAYMDVGVLIATFRYFGGLADKMASEFFDQGSVYSAVVYEPHGVCLAIMPFNWPPVHIGGKVAPSLAAGNTMIVKPGEQAPLTALRIVEVLQKVLPRDVVLAVPGQGAEVPQALIKNPLVQMVSLTGSTATGTAAALAAAPTLTATALELGGKNAFIIFPDADVDQAVLDTIEGAFFNKGEACTAASRIYVHQSIYADFLARLVPAVKALRAGDGLDAGTQIGPVVSKARQELILNKIREAEAEGAVLAAQGTIPTDPRLADGFFVPATLFKDIRPEMALAQDEIFGPVTGVGSFDSEEEVIRWVNDSEHGLFAAVYSGDFTRAMRVARELEVGAVLVNNYFRGLLGTPFGGVKGSGHGREHWAGTLREWSRIKNIRFPSGQGGPIPVWVGAKEVLLQ